MSNRKARNEQRPRGAPDEYDRDLELDNQGRSPVEEHRDPGVNREAAGTARRPEDRAAGMQKDRKGQAQSPVELTPNQPEPKREGRH